MYEFIEEFFKDARTNALLLAIATSVALAIIAAIRLGEFDWRKLGNFYGRMIVPYLLGWMFIYAVGKLGVATLLGDELWGQVAATVGYAPAMLNLVGDIVANLQKLRDAPQTLAARKVEREAMLLADEQATLADTRHPNSLT